MSPKDIAQNLKKRSASSTIDPEHDLAALNVNLDIYENITKGSSILQVPMLVY